jgi:hypothetical protein
VTQRCSPQGAGRSQRNGARTSYWRPKLLRQNVRALRAGRPPGPASLPEVHACTLNPWCVVNSTPNNGQDTVHLICRAKMFHFIQAKWHNNRAFTRPAMVTRLECLSRQDHIKLGSEQKQPIIVTWCSSERTGK